jgi:23S rRNA (pseudouridine1915-N3)-methyltransferase
MRLQIIAIGRLKAGPLLDLAQEYARRITTPLTISEVEERRKLPAAELKLRENELLLAALPKGATVVALDAGGKQVSSENFAALVARWRDDGAHDLAFLIGGADGLSPATLARADVTLSLGTMIWPHLLARVMLLEQLYRAQQIMAGHPYHRA